MLRGGAATDAATTRGSSAPGSPSRRRREDRGAQREHGERRHDGRLGEGDGDVAAPGFFGPETEDQSPGLFRRGGQRGRDHRQRAVGEREAAQLDAHLDLAGGVEPRGGLLTRRAGCRDEVFPRQSHDGVELDADDEAGGDLRVDERRYGRCAVEPTAAGAPGPARRLPAGPRRGRGGIRRRAAAGRGEGASPGDACRRTPPPTGLRRTGHRRACLRRAASGTSGGAGAQLPRPTRGRRPCPCRRRRPSPRATASRSRSRSRPPSGAASRRAPRRGRPYRGGRPAAPGA